MANNPWNNPKYTPEEQSALAKLYERFAEADRHDSGGHLSPFTAEETLVRTTSDPPAVCYPEFVAMRNWASGEVKAPEHNKDYRAALKAVISALENIIPYH